MKTKTRRLFNPEMEATLDRFEEILDLDDDGRDLGASRDKIYRGILVKLTALQDAQDEERAFATDQYQELETRVEELTSALVDVRAYLETGAPVDVMTKPIGNRDRREYEWMLGYIDDALTPSVLTNDGWAKK